MSDRSEIEWTDATWNPVRGCTPVSDGCRNCYAARQAHRFSGPGKPYEGLTRLTDSGPKWTGKVRLVSELLDQPLRWRKPRRIFVCSMSDLFHDSVPDEFIAAVWCVMENAVTVRGHLFQILTKRSDRQQQFVSMWRGRHREFLIDCTIQKYGIAPSLKPSPDRIWIGVSCENQKAANERIPHLLDTPAAVRFVSAEPLLGPVNFRLDVSPPNAKPPFNGQWRDALRGNAGRVWGASGFTKLDWVIVGGESGPGARPCDVEWIRSAVKQCREAQVPVFVKQLGSNPIDSSYSATFGPDGKVHYTQPAGHPRELEHRDAIERGAAEGYQVGPMPLRLASSKGANPLEWPKGLDVREQPR